MEMSRFLSPPETWPFFSIDRGRLSTRGQASKPSRRCLSEQEAAQIRRRRTANNPSSTPGHEQHELLCVLGPRAGTRQSESRPRQRKQLISIIVCGYLTLLLASHRAAGPTSSFEDDGFAGHQRNFVLPPTERPARKISERTLWAKFSCGKAASGRAKRSLTCKLQVEPSAVASTNVLQRAAKLLLALSLQMVRAAATTSNRVSGVSDSTRTFALRAPSMIDLTHLAKPSPAPSPLACCRDGSPRR